jgi:predicted nuclease with TOPRIM domain
MAEDTGDVMAEDDKEIIIYVVVYYNMADLQSIPTWASVFLQMPYSRWQEIEKEKNDLVKENEALKSRIEKLEQKLQEELYSDLKNLFADVPT